MYRPETAQKFGAESDTAVSAEESCRRRIAFDESYNSEASGGRGRDVDLTSSGCKIPVRLDMDISDDSSGGQKAMRGLNSDTNAISLPPREKIIYMHREKRRRNILTRITTRAVRTFTAPHTGKISITADDGNGKSRILGSTKYNKQGAFVRVMYNGRKVWPVSSDLNGARVPGGDGTSVGAVNVDETLLDVKKGDKIYFEVHTGGGHYDYDFWEKRTYWNPVVKYVSQSSYAGEVRVTDPNGRELTDYEAAAASGGFTVSVPISSVYEDIGSLALIAAVYDNSGRLISAETETADLKQDDTHTYNLRLDGISGAAGGCLKLFTFKDMSSLRPLE